MRKRGYEGHHRVCHEDPFGKQDLELSLKPIKSLRTHRVPQNEMSGDFDNLTVGYVGAECTYRRGLIMCPKLMFSASLSSTISFHQEIMMVLRKFRNRHDSPWIEASEGGSSINPSHYQLPGTQSFTAHMGL